MQISVVTQIVFGFIARFFSLERQDASKLHPSGITCFLDFKKNTHEFLNVL